MLGVNSLPDFLLLNFEQVELFRSNGREDASLEDQTSTGGGRMPANNYKNVESKVKKYISNMPQPRISRSRTILKKHTSMPSCGTGHSDEMIRARRELEREYQEYRRSVDHIIEELRSKLDCSVALINEQNLEKFELMRKMEEMRMAVDSKEVAQLTVDQQQEQPWLNPLRIIREVMTPQSTTIDKFTSPSVVKPQLQRTNLSFSTSTASDEHMHDESSSTPNQWLLEQDLQQPGDVTVHLKERNSGKRKRAKKYLASLLCGCANTIMTYIKGPSISFII